MSDLRELYQEVVLDHGRNPRNFHTMESPDRQSVGFNPLCGDKLTLYVRYRGDTLEEISFQGSGCAISTASASLLTETLRGKSKEEVDAVTHDFVAMVTGEGTFDPERLGKLAVLAGVRDYPVRVKCATLPWRTLEAALQERSDPVSTE
jgi:nitrogen fixation NifU-like protein